MTRLESVAVRLTTAQGWALAVGGICRAGWGEEWKTRFSALASLSVTAADLYGLDWQLARALCQLADETLLAAGASLRRPGLILPPGQSTGGVLGDPAQSPASSPDGAERLAGGLCLVTAPGGPGLCAPEAPARLRRAAARVRALPPDASAGELAAPLLAAELKCALLVLDGTGPGVRGGVVAVSGGAVDAALLPPCP